jgi:Uma2 family endonuclease
MTRLLIRDDKVANDLIQERKRQGLDLYDEVWEGMYVMPTMPNLEHQKMVRRLSTLFAEVLEPHGAGEVYPGANVSDRRTNWTDNFRVPDVIAALTNGRAVNCGTHFCGGPDFLVEIESPGDDTEEKVPFYSKIGARELLIIHRDKRTLRLLRHDGQELVLVQPKLLDGKEWLVSEVLPLAFRRSVSKGVPSTQVRRSDGQPGSWTV